jgi:SAM-dependent methyltransferase
MEKPVRLERSVRRLDVGAGAKSEDGWETMDISPVFAPSFQHDIMQIPWPFEDGEFQELRCWHVLEHLERQHLIPVMNEMHRILSPGGSLDIEVPVFPFWPAIADPTHVSFFVPQTFWYFTHTEHDGISFADHRALYGINTWDLKAARRNEMSSMFKILLVKP